MPFPLCVGVCCLLLALLPLRLGVRMCQEITLAALPESHASLSYDVTVGVIRDIYLMSCTERLVGSCMSQVSRLASELMYVQGNAVDMPVALDADSCLSFPEHAYTLPLSWHTKLL
jgi:hypothetical protein